MKASDPFDLSLLTWPEAEIVLKSHPIIIVPIGAGSKEHGHHLPLNTDLLLAEYLGREVSNRTGIMRLPVMTYGYYPAFVEYPGSITLERETFVQTICGVSRSLHRHGSGKVYFLNTGISTNWALEPARQMLAAEGVIIEYSDLSELGRGAEDAVRRQERGTHADEIETSMLLHIAPEVVKMHLAKRDDNPRMSRGPLTRDPQSKTGIFSPTGAWGDPTLATAEKGRFVLEAIVNEITAFLSVFAAREYQPQPVRSQYMPD